MGIVLAKVGYHIIMVLHDHDHEYMEEPYHEYDDEEIDLIMKMGMLIKIIMLI